MDYTLQIFKFPKYTIDEYFYKNKNLIITSSYENHALFSLGYHHFIDRTRDAMSITNKIDSKNDFYYVVNAFESNIQNYEETINTFAQRYIKNLNTPDNNFYKLWEIYFLFDIGNKNNINIYINDNEDSILKYRNKFYEKSKKDNIYKSISSKNKVDLLIFNNNENNMLENNYIDKLLKYCVDILSSQNKNGELILQVYDTFTLPTIKLLYLIVSLYEESYIYKPFFSRPSDSEKFIICKNYSNKNINDVIDNLNSIINENKGNLFINDIFNDVEVPDNFLKMFSFVNIKLVNTQQILINKIITYIKDNNYYGDKYHEYRNLQIESNKWWINYFFPDNKNYEPNKKHFMDLIKTTVNKNKLELQKFESELN